MTTNETCMLRHNIRPHILTPTFISRNTLQGYTQPFKVCSLIAENVVPSSLQLFNPGCKPVSTKSRQQNEEGKLFIQTEVTRILKERIIEPSNSPWKDQAFIVSSENRKKKRIIIGYSQTINVYYAGCLASAENRRFVREHSQKTVYLVP